jgi:protocatechuate 3,4-dioxygenase beta subunit
MVRSKTLLGIGLFGFGLAAGLLLGFILGGSPPPPPPAVPSSPAAEHLAEVQASPAASQKTPSSAGAHARRPSAPAREPEIPMQQGTGTVHGTVVDSGGHPLEGALVRATPIVRPEQPGETAGGVLPPGAPPPRVDVEEAARAYAATLARQEAGVREATTDAAGNYTLRGLTAEEYRVQAWHTGFLLESGKGWFFAVARAGDRCDFLATPIRRISISVTLPDGSPPAEAVISWAPKGKGTGGSETWTPGEPELDVPPGTYDFTAWAGAPGQSLFAPEFAPGSGFAGEGQGGALYRSAPRTATVDDEGPGSLTLPLEGRPGIRVELAFEGARRPRSIRVAALRLAGASGSDPAFLLGDEGVRSLWIDDAAEAVLPGLEPGTYLVGVTYRGNRVGPTTTTTVATGLERVELRIPEADATDWVRVRVLDPVGSPLRDALVEAGLAGSEGSDTVPASLVPEKDGSYRIEHYAKGAPVRGEGFHSYVGISDVGPGPYSWFVRATSPRFGVAVATYDPGTDREVTLRFAAPALLRVAVTGFAGNPRRSRALLFLEWEGSSPDMRDRMSCSIDADGRGSFPPTAPGKYSLELRLAEDGAAEDAEVSYWSTEEVSKSSLTLPSGETEASVHLPLYCDLTVTFEGEAPGLERIGTDGVPGREEDGDATDGKVTFRDLPEGRYRLIDHRRGAMWLDLPMSGPVSFQPAPFDSLFVKVTGEGYLRGLGLRTGDLIVAIDGVELRDREAMRKALGAALVHGTARLSVLRAGTTFDVSGDIQMLGEDAGSEVQPWVR